MNDAMASMKGHILISMPHMQDPYFNRSLIFVCEHDEEGAMGLIFNRSFEDESVKKIFPTLIVNDTAISEVIDTMYFGGPVDLQRAFLLHSTDFEGTQTVQVNDNFALTSDAEILDAIKAGKGPRFFKMMLGYAGWGAGQLEREIENGDWLFQETTEKFVFGGEDQEKWSSAAQSFGIGIAPSSSGMA